jgi:transcriptional regulator with XRE-family HTH domain
LDVPAVYLDHWQVTNVSTKRREPPLLAVGNAIRALRKSHGLTQEELAASANLNLSYLSAVERGDNNPTLTTLLSVSTALGVTVEELMAAARL